MDPADALDPPPAVSPPAVSPPLRRPSSELAASKEVHAPPAVPGVVAVEAGPPGGGRRRASRTPSASLVERALDDGFPLFRRLLVLHREHLARREGHDLLEPDDDDVRLGYHRVEPRGDVQSRRRPLAVRVPRPGPHGELVRRGVVLDGMREEGVADGAIADAAGPLAGQRVDAVLGLGDAAGWHGESRVRRDRGRAKVGRGWRFVVEAHPRRGGRGCRRRPAGGAARRRRGGGRRPPRPAVVEEVREHVGEAFHVHRGHLPERSPRALDLDWLCCRPRLQRVFMTFKHFSTQGMLQDRVHFECILTIPAC